MVSLCLTRKMKQLPKPQLYLLKQGGLDFESLDGQPAELFFMIAAEGGSADTHLQVLAELSKLLMNEDFIAALKGAQDTAAITGILNLAQAQLDAENKEEESSTDVSAANVDEKQPYIVAVTACPTGIAHTYMAEDALKKKAQELGVQIKVETRGSEGVKHGLTKEDIDKADGIIVAVSKMSQWVVSTERKWLNVQLLTVSTKLKN